MSNSTNLNRMSWAINTLWELEVNTNNIMLADSLLAVMRTLRTVKEEMVKEREERIRKMFADALADARESSPLTRTTGSGTADLSHRPS